MLEDALPRFEAEIQAVELWVAALQPIHDTQALQIVLKAAKLRHAGVERILPCVAERCMAKVVRQTDRLHQILIEAQ